MKSRLHGLNAKARARVTAACGQIEPHRCQAKETDRGIRGSKKKSAIREENGNTGRVRINLSVPMESRRGYRHSKSGRAEGSERRGTEMIYRMGVRLSTENTRAIACRCLTAIMLRMRILMLPVSRAGPVSSCTTHEAAVHLGAAGAHKQTPLIINASMEKIAM